MTIKVSVFIARKDGGPGWLDEANTTVLDGEDCGFQKCIGSMENDIGLTHVRTTAFDFRFIQTTYSVKINA